MELGTAGVPESLWKLLEAAASEWEWSSPSSGVKKDLGSGFQTGRSGSRWSSHIPCPKAPIPPGYNSIPCSLEIAKSTLRVGVSVGSRHRVWCQICVRWAVRAFLLSYHRLSWLTGQIR